MQHLTQASAECRVVCIINSLICAVPLKPNTLGYRIYQAVVKVKHDSILLPERSFSKSKSQSSLTQPQLTSSLLPSAKYNRPTVLPSMLITATAPLQTLAAMGSSPCTNQSSNSDSSSKNSKSTTPLPREYESFLNSISNKISHYLDHRDDEAVASATSTSCTVCGGTRNASGRHEKSTNDVPKRCECR